MKLNEILKKIAKGEELTDSEKEFLNKYEEPADKSEEIANLKDQLAAMTTERDTLKNKADEEENKNLSDVQKLQKDIANLQDQVKNLTTERDSLKQTAAENAFRYGIEELARKHKCNDVEYLLFKAQGAKLDLSKDAKVSEFMESFKKDSPKFFDADVNNGGGGTPPDAEGGNDNNSQSRIDELLKKDSLSEKEVAEVIKLHDELNNQA